MAGGKPAGTIFWELALDKDSFSRSQREILRDASATALNVEKSFKGLGVVSDQMFAAMRARSENMFFSIKNDASKNYEEYVRAYRAHKEQIDAIDRKQYPERMARIDAERKAAITAQQDIAKAHSTAAVAQASLLDSMKKNWVAASAVIVASWMAVNKAMAWAELGARAEQATTSFRMVAETAGESADDILAGMQRASAGTVDASNIMQAAVKGMVLDLKGNQLIEIMEAARVAARMKGVDVQEAYEGITNAIAVKLPRALRQYGLVSMEQAALVKKAMKEGVEDVDLYTIAMLNAQIHAAKFGEELSGNASESVQRFHAQVKEIKETIGSFVILVGQKALGAMYGLAAALTSLAAPFLLLKGDVEGWKGALASADDLMDKSIELMSGRKTAVEEGAAAQVQASAKTVEQLKKERDEWVKNLQSQIANLKAGKESAKEIETLNKRIIEDTRKTRAEIEGIGETTVEKEAARIASQAAVWEKAGADKVRIALWVVAETIKAQKTQDEEIKKAEEQIYDAVLKIREKMQKGALDAVEHNQKEGKRITDDRIKAEDDFNNRLKEALGWRVNEHDKAMETILLKEEDAIIKNYKDWEAGYISLAQLDEANAAERAKAAAAGNVQGTKRLEDEANFYASILGMEEEYRARKLELIERERKARIAAGIDAVAAEKKSAQDIAALEYALFRKKSDQIAKGLGDMAQAFAALSTMYEEGSDAQQKMQEAAKAMIVLQQAVAVVNAVAAISAAAAAPFPAGFVAMAAMAAAMGNLLASAGIAFGGGSGSSAPSLPASTGLGLAPGESSESVSKSWERLMEIDTLQYRELTGIHDSMRDLNRNISGLISSIFRSGGLGAAAGGMTPGTQASPWENSSLSRAVGIAMGGVLGGLLSSPIGKALGSIFGGKTSTSVVSGIATGDASLRDLIAGGGMGALGYADITQKTSGGWFKGDKSKSWTQYAELDQQVSMSIDAVFKGIADTLDKAGTILLDDTAAILDYVLEGGKVKLSGTAAEMEKQFSDYISRVGDTAAAALFTELVNAYAVAGEGALETVTRLAVDFATMNDVLKMTNQQISGTKFEMVGFTEAMIEMAGGLDILTEAAAAYYDNFFSDVEKQARLQGQLMEGFADLGKPMPGSRAEYRDLVESFDLTTKAGQEAYVALLQMAGAADTFYTYIEDEAQNAADAAIKARQAAQQDAQKNLDDATKELVSAQNAYNAAFQKYLDDQVKMWEAQLSAQQDYVTGLTDRIEQVKKWMSGTERSTTAVVGSRAAWETEYGRLKGQATTDKGVSDFLSYATEYLSFQQKYTSGNYKDIYDLVMQDVRSLGDLASRQLPVAERQLSAIQAATNSAKAAAAAQLAATNATNLTLAQLLAKIVTAQTAVTAAQAVVTALPVAPAPVVTPPAASGVASGGYGRNSPAWNEFNALLGAKPYLASEDYLAGDDADWERYLSLRKQVYGYAKGGLSSGPSIFGEKGPEWAVPTYEPERSNFLRDVGADPDAIGRAVAKYVSGGTGGDGKSINVNLYIDGKKITDTVVRGIKSGDSDLIRTLKKAVA